VTRPDAHVIEALREAVTASARLDLAALRAAAVAKDTSVDRTRLSAALDALEADGVLRRPKKDTDWDRTRRPFLPRWVARVPRPRPARVALEWPPDVLTRFPAAADLPRPTPYEIAVLRAVAAWLPAGPSGRPFVPARERSLEVFRDEKQLDTLAGSRLFTRGVLSHELLRAEVVPAPFVTTWVAGRADGEPLCVVAENHHAWFSLVRAARASAARHAGVHVGYGGGNQFSSGAAGAALLEPPVRAVSYFGDLDPTGLDIPVRAAAACPVPVRPAVGLYRRLLVLGHRDPRPAPLDPAVAAARARWLGPELAPAATELLVEGVRLAQEAVGTDALRGTGPADWV
jgi:hypothetical protein